MAEDAVVLTDITSGVATITINRPDKRNALNAAVRRAFVAALAKLEEDADVRVATSPAQARSRSSLVQISPNSPGAERWTSFGSCGGPASIPPPKRSPNR